LSATDSHTAPQLHRGLSLTQATAINMIDMVGIGPFITLPFIVGLMQGPMAIWAWLLGALLAYMDGMVWAEMGAQWPEAGGSYVFLKNLFKGNIFGKLLPFLFIWQTIIQAPLVVASGAIGFSHYLTFLIPLGDVGKKVVSGSLVILIVALLYRDIKSIGKVSVVLSVITIGTILWLILSGISHWDKLPAMQFVPVGLHLDTLLFVALGQSSLKAVYSYLGYYNVCHLGAEIINPQKNIPRAIFISITGIALLYLGMQLSVLCVLPWQQVATSDFVVSTYFQHIYNHLAGQVATVLILLIALASLFSVILGYSRIPYAAARNGDFFPVFGRLHPTRHFPHISLLAIGSLAFVFSLLFKMKEIITAIIIMRILIQFVSQAVGIILWHYRKQQSALPYRMPLFPLPAIISIIIWLFIFISSPPIYWLYAFSIIGLGTILFLIKEYRNRAQYIE
jgi:fructoselysine transporter